MERNRFKERLQTGETQVGIWSSLCSQVGAEILADAGFDWILIDTEHSPVDISGVYPLLQALSRGTASPVVRVAWNDPVLLKRVLDIGAKTVLVPFVQNAKEASLAVTSCRYPPKGTRGVAGSTRATRYGRDKTYFAKASDELCLVVQVETEDALLNLPEIADVEGVDAVFIGPSDLAASMGHIGDPGHEKVQAAIRSALRTLRNSRTPAGILAVTPEDAARYMSLGFNFVAGGVDTSMLAKASDDLAAVLHNAAGTQGTDR